MRLTSGEKAFEKDARRYLPRGIGAKSGVVLGRVTPEKAEMRSRARVVSPAFWLEAKLPTNYELRTTYTKEVLLPPNDMKQK